MPINKVFELGRRAVRKEVGYNIKKFGDEYKKYMKRVPMWSIFRGLRK